MAESAEDNFLQVELLSGGQSKFRQYHQAHMNIHEVRGQLPVSFLKHLRQVFPRAWNLVGRLGWQASSLLALLCSAGNQTQVPMLQINHFTN